MVVNDMFQKDDSLKTGTLYERSLVHIMEPNIDPNKQLNQQKYCSSLVEGISILSLNVGIVTYSEGDVSHTLDEKLRGSLI